MPYDPFASPPSVQHDQVMPNPMPAEQTSALATIANAGRANAARQFDRAGFLQSLSDWRAAMPNRPMGGMNPHDATVVPNNWRADWRGWKDTRPDPRSFMTFGQPSAPVAPVDGAPQPVDSVPPVQQSPMQPPMGGGGWRATDYRPAEAVRQRFGDWRSFLPSGM